MNSMGEALREDVSLGSEVDLEAASYSYSFSAGEASLLTLIGSLFFGRLHAGSAMVCL